MADSIFLKPVSEDDPCGPDMRWDPDFLALNDAFATAVSHDAEAVLEGEVVATNDPALDELVERATALSAHTKDIRVLAILAEANWRHAGLVAFAEAMEDLASVQEAWPGPADGVHPRADEFDGDLGERAAALGRLLNQIPALAATVGWGGHHVADADQLAAANTLKGVFDVWKTRFDAAFGGDLPSVGDAWRSLQGLTRHVGVADAGGGETIEEGDAEAPAARKVAVDAWDLIDRAVIRMIDQDHHSPALPILRLLATWRSLGIIEIADKLRPSGVTLEQLLNSVKQQIE